ncbi:hypothetical protein [Wansuia hejianensis]|uniref:Uncharacterized protein n=1 Tax=Wansuia hejianensis TaxID=2763667 RepID=A0A926EZC7_9FIRM|nr:hypothetical protein [Wansuia hejianensis]MBC8590436.1 hypothetical protein [Wansuia hejianensis]
MFLFFYDLFILLFLISLIAYIVIVLKEKVYIKKNIILIDNKNLTQEDIDKIEIKEFILNDKIIRAGDEIRVITKENKTFRGILIGAKMKNKTIHIITYKDEVLELNIDNLLKLRIISKYGRFFNY